MNAPDRNIHDAADGLLKEQAIEALVDRLAEGKAVHTFTSRDIFDCAVDNSQSAAYSNVLDILDAVLALNGKAGDEFFLAANEAAAKAKEVIEAFVNGKEDWIEEEAAEIEAHDGEEG